MSRPCAASAAVGAELLAAVAVGLATLRRHLTDPDPKTALRAVAELTKLLGVCARHGVAADVEVVPPPVAVPAAAGPADVLSSPRERPPSADQDPLAGRAEHGKPRGRGAHAKTSLPGGRGAHDPSLARPAPHLPPGGRTLTSFLGSPAAKADAG